MNYPGAVRDPDTREWISDADITHRKHAVIETVFADLIDGPLARVPHRPNNPDRSAYGISRSEAAFPPSVTSSYDVFRPLESERRNTPSSTSSLMSRRADAWEVLVMIAHLRVVSFPLKPSRIRLSMSI